MAEPLTTTTSSGGGQTTTQNPQTAAPQSDNGAARAQSVQPGTATSLLTSQQGVALTPSALTTVDLTASTQAPAVKPVVTPKPAINMSLLGLSIVLCALAIIMFWWTSHSAKNTTISK